MKRTLILLIAFTSFGLSAQRTAEDYFNRGISKSDLKNYYGAIRDFTKAIKLRPNVSIAYFNRGISKENLQDYYGAIADYTKAIEIFPDYSEVYFNRGYLKYRNDI